MILIPNRHRTCREPAPRIHYLGPRGFPPCGVLGSDNPLTGLQRPTRVSRDENLVTCRRCRVSLET